MPLHDTYWNAYDELDDLPLPLRQEIEQFFSIYKELEHKDVSVGGARARTRSRRSPRRSSAR